MLLKIEAVRIDIDPVALQVGIEGQGQVQIVLVVDLHRLAEAAQHGIEIVAVPEKAHALPVFRHALILALQVAARLNTRLVGGLGDAAGDIAGAGVVRGHGDDVLPGGIQKRREVKSKGPHAHFIIARQLAVDVQVTGLPHALEGQDHPLARLLRRHPQRIAIEGAGAPLAAAAVLDGHGKQIGAVEGMGQRHLLPVAVVIDPVRGQMALGVPAGGQRLFHGKGVGQTEPPAVMEIKAVTHLHPSGIWRTRGAGAFRPPPACRFRWRRRR